MGHTKYPLDQIVRRKQPLPFPAIERMLLDNNFEPPNTDGGGSHVTFTHPTTTITVTVVRRSTSPANWQGAAKACIQVQSWEKRREKTLRDFLIAATGKDKIPGTQPTIDLLPEMDITITDENNPYCIVRNSQYPQIGTVCPLNISLDRADAIRREIEDKKAELLGLLEEMTTRYEYIAAHDDKGNISLHHRVYTLDRELNLLAYDPSATQDAISILQGCKEATIEADQSTHPVVESLLSETNQSERFPNGNLLWTVPIRHFLTGERTTFPLETTRQRRANSSEIYGLAQKILEFERGSQKDSKRLQRLLKPYGVTLHLSQCSKELEAISPAEKAPVFTIPVVYDNPSLLDLHKAHTEANDEKEAQRIDQQLFEIVEEWAATKAQINQAVYNYLTRMHDSKKMLSDLQRAYPQLQNQRALKKLEPGEHGHFHLKHPALNESAKIRVMCLKTDDGPLYCPFPEDVENLKQNLTRAMEQAATARDITIDIAPPPSNG
ncbi:MAG: hypothetical protein KDI13_09070 [Alphaproteobacteria bacterium]|nr:hypothetical protein [Alphaproteobacteria bacterium]